MNRRFIAATAIAGVTAAASVGTALALPSRAMSHSGTFTFLAVENSSHTFNNHNFVGSSKEVRGGHFFGTDSFRCHPTSNTSARCNVAASYKSGQLFAKFTESLKTGVLTGMLTGGNGKFTGATGTVKGAPANSTSERVTITYQTP